MNRRVNRKGKATQQALIDAAIELWSATGWRGTGITPVAERAGVTDATLLHHFGSKEKFLLDVLAELDRREVARYESWGSPTGLDVIRLLPDWVRADPEHPGRPGLWKLHLMLQAENLDPGDPAYDYYAFRQRFLHDLYAKAIRAGQTSGEIRTDADPDLVAAQIVAFIMGMQLQIHHGPEHVDITPVFEDFANHMITHLTAL